MYSQEDLEAISLVFQTLLDNARLAMDLQAIVSINKAIRSTINAIKQPLVIDGRELEYIKGQF
jgi:hypothetical protein